MGGIRAIAFLISQTRVRAVETERQAQVRRSSALARPDLMSLLAFESADGFRLAEQASTFEAQTQVGVEQNKLRFELVAWQEGAKRRKRKKKVLQCLRHEFNLSLFRCVGCLQHTFF